MSFHWVLLRLNMLDEKIPNKALPIVSDYCLKNRSAFIIQTRLRQESLVYDLSWLWVNIHSIWVYNFCKYLLIHFFFRVVIFPHCQTPLYCTFYAKTCFMFIVQCWLRIVYSHMLCLVFTILLCLLFLSNVIFYYIDYKYSLW